MPIERFQFIGNVNAYTIRCIFVSAGSILLNTCVIYRWVILKVLFELNSIQWFVLFEQQSLLIVVVHTAMLTFCFLNNFLLFFFDLSFVAKYVQKNNIYWNNFSFNGDHMSKRLHHALIFNFKLILFLGKIIENLQWTIYLQLLIVLRLSFFFFFFWNVNVKIDTCVQLLASKINRSFVFLIKSNNIST